MKKHTQSTSSHTLWRNILGIIIVLLLIGYVYFERTSHQIKNSQNTFVQAVEKNSREIKIGEQSLFAYFVDDTDSRARGLSIFETLPENEAMVFVFEKPAKYSFWMRDMKFPIDIIWLDENKKIVFIKEHARVEDFPETYKPTQLAQYVVEVNAGYVKKHNIYLENQFIW